ncbi:discoidin domain-containing protein [Cohnella silvisoli]|uniref:Discoidin domain-containing protein n=1 Tax=Cohnella silvisoli TaxID=2873699 RepID=A0ABV1L3F7_9BACL|nr:discoidin domain-containing protein [Cohnella silvisoli]MCD9026191.1 discoidin domain-containing protein [Cohnella silvisoli]
MKKPMSTILVCLMMAILLIPFFSIYSVQGTAVAAPPLGDSLKLIVKNDGSTGNHYLYRSFSNSSYTFQTGDYLEYDVSIDQRVAGIGGLDILTTTSQNLRDSGLTDQNGLSGHTAADLSAYAYKSVYHRKLAIPSSLTGKTVAKWFAAGEADNPLYVYAARYDNISITDGSGTVRKVVYRNAADANLNTVELNAYTSSSSLAKVVDNLDKENIGTALRLAVTNDGTVNNHYLYRSFSNQAYTFQTGDYIEYDTQLENYSAGLGGIDVTTTDSFNFRDVVWTDQNGIYGHPTSDISSLAYKDWYHRKLAVPASMIGKVAAKWMAAGENDDPNNVGIAYYDNIVVTDGNGNVKKVIFKEASDATLNTVELSAYTSASAMTTMIPTALYGIPQASSSYITGDPWLQVGGPKNVEDGSLTGYWHSRAASPNWVEIDLQGIYNIKRWAVWHSSSFNDLPAYNTRDFKLQTSLDGVTYTDAAIVTGNTAGITDLDVNVNARYVRLYITKGTQDGYDGFVRIREFEVFSSSEASISMNKPVTASSFQLGVEPANAVDGSYNYWQSNAPSPNWLRVDLGKVYKVKRWVVWNASVRGDPAAYNTRAYKLQVSSDGVNFTDVDTVTGNTAAVTDRNIEAVGRYFRLYITEGTQPGSDGFVRLVDLGLYGDLYGKDTPVTSKKIVTASSTDAGTLPSSAVDDNLSTGWRSSGTGTQSLTVDLGQKHTLDRWVVKHAGANWGNDLNNTKDFKLQVSNDGTTFTDVDTVSGNTEKATDRGFASVVGRYVRLNITQGTQTGGDGKARIQEFRVYGSPISDVPNPGVITTLYPTDDIVIASYNVTAAPYNADSTGVNDATLAIQKALDDCYATGGGVVFMPAGKYKITDSLSIPAHVTLRGDWQDPDAGTNYGTVIMANVPSSTLELPGLIRIGGSGGLKGVTIYYPNQSAASPVSYPYTIELPGRAYHVEDYMHQTVQNVTLLNSYRGISAYRSNTTAYLSVGEEYYFNNVKGTVLKQAMRLYNSADVGKVVNVKFNNSYWADAPAGFNPQSRTALDTFTRAQGKGLEIGDIEISEFYNISLHDYQIGVHVVNGSRTAGSGTFFGLDVQNSNVALKVDYLASPQVGFVFSNSTFKANQGTNPVAVQLNNNIPAPFIFNNSTIGGGAATALQLTTSSFVSLNNCTFDNWTGIYAITANNGSLTVEGSTFTPTLTSSKKAVNLSGSLSSAALLGNTFTGSSTFFYDNSSAGDVKVQHTGYTFAQHGVTGHTFKTSLPKPPNTNIYNVKTAYGAKGDAVTDDTAAIQNALNAAGTAGGGTVFLPAGQYKINTHLTVPANVELRGVEDVPHKGDAMGSVLSAYEGRRTATPDSDTAFITLSGTNSGVRGLTFYYPEQTNSISPSGTFMTYPWAIRGNASGVYAINLNFVNAYKGIDFGYTTGSADNHYISNVKGSSFKNAIAIGNSSEGWVEDTLFNAGYAVRTTLPNRIREEYVFDFIFPFTWSEQTGYLIGKTDNEHMLNNFIFGANTSYKYVAQGGSGGNVTAINNSADGAFNYIVVDATGTTGLNVVNSQTSTYFANSRHIQMNGGTAKFFNFTSAKVFYDNPGITVTGGNSVFQGIYYPGQNVITGGTTQWNSVWFQNPGGTGAQLTVSPGVTGSSISGSAGKDVLNIVNNAGSGMVLSNNIKY